MMNIKDLFSTKLRLFYYHNVSSYFKNTSAKRFSMCGKNAELNGPLMLDPQKMELGDFVRLQPGIRVIAFQGRVVVKKFTAISAGCVIIPGSHTPTVGMPQYLSTTHVNDKDGTIVINEDCWIGAGAYLLSHAEIGRGSIVAAGSIVTKKIPPYAVVAGNPAKIIACRFSIDQILEHERILYPENERMSKEELEAIFAEHYEGKRSIGTNEISDEDLARMNEAKRTKGIEIYK